MSKEFFKLLINSYTKEMCVFTHLSIVGSTNGRLFDNIFFNAIPWLLIEAIGKDI